MKIPALLLCDHPPESVPVWAVALGRRFAIRVEPVDLEGIKVFVWTPPGEPEPDTALVMSTAQVWLEAIEHRRLPKVWSIVWPCPPELAPAEWLQAESPDPAAPWLGILHFPDLALFDANPGRAGWPANPAAEAAYRELSDAAYTFMQSLKA
ncbi:MAG TPA: hypothetical protein VMB21_11215 [Candidatus Limnocylindria bacterium]|nr:hypothetical protein [Candidatus Limnocylindria bacterium]